MFGPRPLLVEPDMPSFHVHHAQRERHADSSLQVRGGSENPDN
jgi:hypothetical protein